MEHSIQKQVIHPSTRFGLHYFPDSLHYSNQDLEKWLPKIKELGASWIVLIAEEKRAIPESFIKSLIKSGITPILHFPFSCISSVSHDDLSPLLEAYSHWGVKYIIFFDRPNQRSAWGDTDWAKENLIKRFVEKFLPLFQEANKFNLTTVFPPLEPGGQYWDTIFLRESLELLKTRISFDLLSKMVLSAYAWDDDKPLNWGSGGFERWPMAKPYCAPPNSQDQRGFRIYEWYQFIGQNIFQQNPSILLLQVGIPGLPLLHRTYTVNSKMHSDKVVAILKSLAGENVYDPLSPQEALEPIPEQVIACNFWMLTAEKDDPNQSHAWFTPSLQPSLPAQSVMNWIHDESLESTVDETSADVNEDIPSQSKTFPFSRYLLFPSLEWLLDREQRDKIQAYIETYQPIIGFSIEEAKKSAVVTVVGDSSDFSDEQLDQIRQYGCFVTRLSLEKENKMIEIEFWADRYIYYPSLGMGWDTNMLTPQMFGNDPGKLNTAINVEYDKLRILENSSAGWIPTVGMLESFWNTTQPKWGKLWGPEKIQIVLFKEWSVHQEWPQLYGYGEVTIIINPVGSDPNKWQAWCRYKDGNELNYHFKGTPMPFLNTALEEWYKAHPAIGGGSGGGSQVVATVANSDLECLKMAVDFNKESGAEQNIIPLAEKLRTKLKEWGQDGN